MTGELLFPSRVHCMPEFPLYATSADQRPAVLFFVDQTLQQPLLEQRACTSQISRYCKLRKKLLLPLQSLHLSPCIFSQSEGLSYQKGTVQTYEVPLIVSDPLARFFLAFWTTFCPTRVSSSLSDVITQSAHPSCTDCADRKCHPKEMLRQE